MAEDGVEGDPMVAGATMVVPRFWSLRDGRVRLNADGFLADPTARFLSTSTNPGVYSFSEIREMRGLVLLGEPGSGKSTAIGMNSDWPSPIRELLPEGFMGDVLPVQLGAYGSEERLARVFEGDRMRQWVTGDHEMALVLDSFDECQAGIENLRRLFASWLAEWPTDRLLLRLTCRTAQWPDALEDRLRASFDPEGFEVFEIAPLRAVDAAVVAAEFGLDGDDFVKTVRSRRIGSLAARPLVLKMLIGEALTGDLPDNVVELFRRSVARMAEEHDGLRAAGDALAARDVVAVARRISAATVFGSVNAVGEAPGPDVVTFDDLSSGDEPNGLGVVGVTPQVVGRAVATALFTSRGPGRFGLAHYSFAEFLAAEWVRENELTDAQVRQLLLTSDAAILPTLRNVAAWLAGSDPDRYGWLVELEPDIAFGGALDLPSDHLRRIATASLFANVRTEMSQRRDYSGLRYPDLADELRVELRSGDEDRALLACAIAADCQLIVLVDDLATLALDEQVSMRLRIRAAAAIDRSHTDQPTRVLAPLVTGDLADDTDELLGIALTASWPHAVDLDTVLTVLRRPRQRNLFGMYRHFMSYELASSLQPEHRDPLLRWLIGVERNHRLDAFDTLADAIVRLACEHPDPASDRLLATLLWRRTAHSEGLLVDTIRPDDASDPLSDHRRRRQLLTAMLEVVDLEERDGYVHGLTTGYGPYRPVDFGWLAEQIPTLDEPMQARALLVAGELFSPVDRPMIDVLLGLPVGHPLREHLAYWIEPRPIDDPLGARWRERRRPDPAPEPPSPAELEGYIVADLDHFEAGDRLAFEHADGVVAADEHGIIEVPMMSHIVERPRWVILAEETRSRFLECGIEYVRGEPPDGRRAGEAGVHALIMIEALRPDLLQEMEPEVWERWASAIIWWLRRTRHEGDHVDRFVERARTAALPALQDALAESIIAELPDSTYLPARLVELIWGERVGRRLHDFVDESDVQGRAELVELLAEHSMPHARAFLLDDLNGSLPERRLRAAALLLLHGNEADWVEVLTHVYADVSFGRSVVEGVVSSLRRRKLPSVDASVIGDLFLWLSEQYPPAEDPKLDSAHVVGTREEIGQWRDGLPSELVARGDDDAVSVLARLAREAPDQRLLEFRLREAIEQRRRNEFRPTSPAELRALASSNRRMVVRTAADLRVLLVRVLADIEEDFLHGNIPQAATLWNESPRLRPKTEDAIADVIARQIDDRLDGLSATSLREVGSRRVRPSGIPERSDILVHVRAGDEPVAVVIECKGAWNDDLWAAMRSQLVDRYMLDRPGAEGIYLAFWFDTDPWDPEDWRQGRCVTMTKSNLWDRLETQATQLVSEGSPVSAVVLDGSWNRPTT